MTPWFTHVWRDLLEPFVGGVVEVDLARRPQVPRGFHEITEKSGSDDGTKCTTMSSMINLIAFAK